MPSRRNRSLAVRNAELALASPQVIGHRIARMAMAGASPTAKDRKELHRMGAEKASAFVESWHAMAMQMLRANQTLAISLWRWYWQSWFTGQSIAWRVPSQSALALGVLSSGMTPIHRRVMANVKRLGRVR
jgi:hypothetical protein